MPLPAVVETALDPLSNSGKDHLAIRQPRAVGICSATESKIGAPPGGGLDP